MRLKKPNDAIDCFDFFKEYNLNPNVYSYNTLMDAHMKKLIIQKLLMYLKSCKIMMFYLTL